MVKTTNSPMKKMTDEQYSNAKDLFHQIEAAKGTTRMNWTTIQSKLAVAGMGVYYEDDIE